MLPSGPGKSRKRRNLSSWVCQFSVRASAQRSKWTSEQKCDDWSVLRINATVGKLVYYTSIEQSAAVDDNDHVDDDDDNDDENDDDGDSVEEDYN